MGRQATETKTSEMIVKLSWAKNYFERGYGFTVVATRIIPITTLVIVAGFDWIWSIPLALALGLASMAVGILDRKYGIWTTENKQKTKELNPFFENMEREIEWIKKELQRRRT